LHIRLGEYVIRCPARLVQLLRIYDCLCDATRLRLLNLLAVQPLCVCHLEAALQLPQARISRHLAYLRRNGLATVVQQGPWRIYSLAEPAPAALRSNLACLQDARAKEPVLARDAARLARILASADCGCATPDVPRRKVLRLAR
jgi:ArsR family transcriptional regulator